MKKIFYFEKHLRFYREFCDLSNLFATISPKSDKRTKNQSKFVNNWNCSNDTSKKKNYERPKQERFFRLSVFEYFVIWSKSIFFFDFRCAQIVVSDERVLHFRELRPRERRAFAFVISFVHDAIVVWQLREHINRRNN